MNNIIYIIFSLILFSCGQVEKEFDSNKKNENNTVEKIEIDTSKITIIPFDTTFHWIFKNAKSTELTKEDLQTIERILNDCLTEYNLEQEQQYNEKCEEHPEYNYKLNQFVIELDRYNRQYVGVTNDKGEKEVWINFYCGDSKEIDRKNIMIVEDGGNCFFNLIINLTKEIYYDFMVNGDA